MQGAAPRMPAEGHPLVRAAQVTAVVISVCVFAYLLYSVRSVALTVFLGLFLAIACEPTLSRLERAGVRRGLGVLALVLGLLLVLSGFVSLALAPAVGQVQEIARNVPGLVADISNSNTRVGQFFAQPQVSSRIRTFLESAPTYIANSVGTVFGVVGAVVGGLFTAVTVVTLMIYFMLAMPRMLDFLRRVLGSEQRFEVLEEALAKVGGYVTGQVTICVCAGITSYVFFLVAGVPYAAVLAIAIALLDAIPQVGATLGSLVGTIVALSVSLPLALGTLAFFLAYQQVENYVIAPRLFSRAVNLSPAAVFIAILVGASLAGVVGALVALPMTAAFKTVFRYVFRDRLAALEAPVGQPAQPGLGETTDAAGVPGGAPPTPRDTD